MACFAQKLSQSSSLPPAFLAGAGAGLWALAAGGVLAAALGAARLAAGLAAGLRAPRLAGLAGVLRGALWLGAGMGARAGVAVL